MKKAKRKTMNDYDKIRSHKGYENVILYFGTSTILKDIKDEHTILSREANY